MVCLMMTLTSFSQSTTKEVKTSTLKQIKKDLDKCDLLKEAYDQKTQVLDSLVSQNLSIFAKLEESSKIENNLRELLSRRASFTMLMRSSDIVIENKLSVLFD